MFTGIVTEIGTITERRDTDEGARLRISAPQTAKGLAVGGSVAVDGVCLTAVTVERAGFQAQVVPETSRRSTLGKAARGVRVNLERPLAAGGELGGHFVQGHVDARARVTALSRRGGEVLLEVQLPASMRGLVVEKGSIAIQGVSLTVASLRPGRAPRFSVALIPHTLRETTLGSLRAGDEVNLEADVLGKYVRALLPGRRRGKH